MNLDKLIAEKDDQIERAYQQRDEARDMHDQARKRIAELEEANSRAFAANVNAMTMLGVAKERVEALTAQLAAVRSDLIVTQNERERYRQQWLEHERLDIAGAILLLRQVPPADGPNAHVWSCPQIYRYVQRALQALGAQAEHDPLTDQCRHGVEGAAWASERCEQCMAAFRSWVAAHG